MDLHQPLFFTYEKGLTFEYLFVIATSWIQLLLGVFEIVKVMKVELAHQFLTKLYASIKNLSQEPILYYIDHHLLKVRVRLIYFLPFKKVGTLYLARPVYCRCLLDIPCQQRARLVSSAMGPGRVESV